MNKLAENIVKVVQGLEGQTELSVAIVEKMLDFNPKSEEQEEEVNEERTKLQGRVLNTTEKQKQIAKISKAVDLVVNKGILRGEAIKQVGLDQCGYSYSLLNAALRKADVNFRVINRPNRSKKKARYWTDDQLRQLVTLNKKGLSAEEISSAVKVKLPKVKRTMYLIKLGTKSLLSDQLKNILAEK